VPLPLPSRGTLGWIAGGLALLWARLRGKAAGRADAERDAAKRARKEGDEEALYDAIRRRGK